MEDSLGDLMKELEADATYLHDPLLPLYVRLDARSFSKLTRKVAKPFSTSFTQAMINTTHSLMHEFSADIGFVQSDEISIGFLPRPKIEGFCYPFKGKQAKIQSVLASHATWLFTEEAKSVTGVAEMPINFDARSISMTYENMALMFMWRHKDATRNAILQYAHNCGHFSKKELDGVKTHEVLGMIGELAGMNWDSVIKNFRMGTFITADKNPEGKTEYNYHCLDRSYHFVYDKIMNKYDK